MKLYRYYEQCYKQVKFPFSQEMYSNKYSAFTQQIFWYKEIFKKDLKKKEKDLKRKGEKGITHMQKMRNVVVFCDLSK